MKFLSSTIITALLTANLFKYAIGFTFYDKLLSCSDSPRLLSSTTARRPLPRRPVAPFDGVAGSNTAIHAKENKDTVSYDGADRGKYIFAVVLFICIWQFSIPPTFRRAKFCPPACARERTLCRNQCVTFQEWSNDIVEYYKNGGGVQWDFSIDPKTLAENEKFVQNLFGSK